MLNPSSTFIGGVFRIPAVRKSDESEYFCHASNSAGTDSLRTILFVRGEDGSLSIARNLNARKLIATKFFSSKKVNKHKTEINVKKFFYSNIFNIKKFLGVYFYLFCACPFFRAINFRVIKFRGIKFRAIVLRPIDYFSGLLIFGQLNFG